MTGGWAVSDDGAEIVRDRDVMADLDYDGCIRQASVPQPGARAEPGPAARSPVYPTAALNPPPDQRLGRLRRWRSDRAVAEDQGARLSRGSV